MQKLSQSYKAYDYRIMACAHHHYKKKEEEAPFHYPNVREDMTDTKRCNTSKWN